MTKRLLDYNPRSGERTWFEYENSTDRITITHEQNVQKVLDFNAALRVEQDYSKHGMKSDWWHYAKVPNTVIMQMKIEDGVDFFSNDPAQQKKMFALLNTKYKQFKTTEKTHNVR